MLRKLLSAIAVLLLMQGSALSQCQNPGMTYIPESREQITAEGQYCVPINGCIQFEYIYRSDTPEPRYDFSYYLPEPEPRFAVTNFVRGNARIPGFTHVIAYLHRLSPGQIDVQLSTHSGVFSYSLTDQQFTQAVIANPSCDMSRASYHPNPTTYCHSPKVKSASFVVPTNPCCCPTPTSGYTHLESCGDTIGICGNQPNPPGWITTGYYTDFSCGMIRNNAKYIEDTNGCPVGTETEACITFDPLPTGWVRIGTFTTIRCGSTRDNAQFIKKIQ